MSLGLETGTVIGGDFRVLEELAEGGMGRVYVAEQLSTGKRRALKVMNSQLVTDERSRRRFVEEAKIGARESVRGPSRSSLGATIRLYDLGFRCARGVSPR